MSPVVDRGLGDDVGALFGPVKTFLAESDDASATERWVAREDGVARERVALRS